MSKQASILYDIQHNTSEFNIKYHMKEIIGTAMITVFMIPENKEKIESMVNIKMSPSEFLPTIIGQAFENMIDQYLSSDMGVEEDYYEESESDKGAEE